VQISYLGPLEVRVGDRVVDVPGRRLRTLLGRLATEVGRPVPPRVLIEALWPQDAPADPANALQSLVSRLRRTLGDPTLVEQLPGGYRLNVAAEDVDAVRFTRLAAQGRVQLSGGAVAEAATTLREALALWRGEPLADDESVEAEAVRVRLADLTAVREGGTDLGAVVAELEALVAEHPLREDLAALRMRALVAVGRPAEALVAYESTRSYLAETLGTDPSTSLQEQYLDVLRLQDAGPVSRRTNLRAALTSFVGRDEAARRVDALLAGPNRLVTIVGAGGAGKTRLASEVAAGWVGRVRDGVWFAELAPVSDPDNIAIAVLDGIGVRDHAALSPTERSAVSMLAARDRVLQALSEADCLVVIDNCEHVVDAAAALVADLLGKCPGVRVIATSREPLGIDGETLYPLTPLAVPAEGASPAEVAATASVRLLLDRASSVGADLVLDEDTTADVVQVVRRLDGLPLAIELAAARLRVLSIAEIATRLGDRFRLLTGGRRTAMPRHRTLRAVVEWSWDLLSPLERDVAEHFSVFGSGATAEAVVAVCAGTSQEIVDDVLHALVDKSLLVAGQDAGEARFRMLETLREYGSERLAGRGRLDVARAAHAAYFAELVRTADAHLRSPRQIEWLRRLDAERDNALTALNYLGEHGQPLAAVEMAVGLAWGWMLRENGKDSARWLTFVLELPGAAESPLYVVAEAMHAVSAFAMPGSDEAVVGRRANFVDLSDRLGLADGNHYLAAVLRPLLLFFAEERERAAELADANLSSPDPWIRAATRTIRVAFLENDGDVEGMRKDVELGMAEWQQVGDHWGLASMLSNRGNLRTLDGDAVGAAADFEEALYELRHLGGTTDDLMVNMRLADLRLRAGDFDGAERIADSVRGQQRRASGFHDERALLGELMRGAVAFERGDDVALQACRELLLNALASIGEPSVFQAHVAAVAHGFLGCVAIRTAELELARHHVTEGVRFGLDTHDLPIVASAGVAVAAFAQAIGAVRDAAVVLGAAARLRGSDDSTAVMIVRLRTGLRASLGEEFEVAYNQGRTLTKDEALARLDPALLD
jgi:predicted ATPase/DNA-binding SARP family transcriptional activator